MIAHLMNTGLGPFYDGLLHLFVTPEDLLPVVALSLLAGQRGTVHGRMTLFALSAAWLAGTAAGRLLGAPPPALPIVMAALTIALGALVALDRPQALPWTAGLAVALGLLHGGANGIEMGRAREGALGGALGVACAIFVVVALLSALVSSLRAPAARIAVRVAGSWIAAGGLFMLGWSLRGA